MFFFFFKQKTAYEMRISDWSSDVCSSDLKDTETKIAAEQCLRFLGKCADGRLAGTMDESNDAYVLARTIQDCYTALDQIRIYVLTDQQAKSKAFKAREINGKTVMLEVMDIERLHQMGRAHV